MGGPIEWTPLERMKRIADVNLWGMIDVTKTFLPLVKKSKGRVVNLSSIAGKVYSETCIKRTPYKRTRSVRRGGAHLKAVFWLGIMV